MASEGTSVQALTAVFIVAIPTEHLIIEDISGCGCGQKFNLWASSSKFEGMGVLERHRFVQNILKDGMYSRKLSAARILPKLQQFYPPCMFICLFFSILPTEIAKLHAISLKLWTPAQWEEKKSTIPVELLDQDQISKSN